MRLIDAEAAIQRLNHLGNRTYRRSKGSINDAIKILSSCMYTPTVDAGPVQPLAECYLENIGIVVRDASVEIYRCGRCKRSWEIVEKPLLRYTYCPFCGAVLTYPKKGEKENAEDHV